MKQLFRSQFRLNFSLILIFVQFFVSNISRDIKLKSRNISRKINYSLIYHVIFLVEIWLSKLHHLTFLLGDRFFLWRYFTYLLVVFVLWVRFNGSPSLNFFEENFLGLVFVLCECVPDDLIILEKLKDTSRYVYISFSR